MKNLIVSNLELSTTELDYSSLASAMEQLDWHAIDQAPWVSDYPYVPQARFQIAYDGMAIYLHYDIQEEFVKAQYIRPNENVWEDSCVEFFVSFDDRENYYNFEFNALGTGLIGYGPAVKTDRSRLSAEEILRVDTFSQLRTVQGQKSWKQILIIPFDLLSQKAENLKGKTVFANFYKCGDGLPQPHFIAWNAIDNPKPNFHLPNFFGEIKFQ